MKHPIERLKERYGLNCHPHDIREAQRAILAGESVMMSRDPNTGKERHIARIKGVAVSLVFSPDSGHIVTILPPADRVRRKPGEHPNKRRRKTKPA